MKLKELLMEQDSGARLVDRFDTDAAKENVPGVIDEITSYFEKQAKKCVIPKEKNEHGDFVIEINTFYNRAAIKSFLSIKHTYTDEKSVAFTGIWCEPQDSNRVEGINVKSHTYGSGAELAASGGRFKVWINLEDMSEAKKSIAEAKKGIDKVLTGYCKNLVNLI